jgi:hypothetical protein
MPKEANFEALELLREYKSDFIEKLTIIDKDGKRVFLTLNEEQTLIWQEFSLNKSLILLKPRQIGASTGISAALFVEAFTSSDPITIVVLTHKKDATEQIMRMHHTYYDQLPEQIKAINPTVKSNSMQLQFASGSRVLGMSARSDGTTRSFTANIVHISEFAFAKDPEELLSAATAAVNDGLLIYESTANYPGDALQNEINKWQNREHSHDDWSFLFFKWSMQQSYRKEITTEFLPSDEERQLKLLHNLDNEQLAWRRAQIAKTSPDRFKREYPLTIEEAYQTSGSTLLKHTDFDGLNIIRTDKEQEWVIIEQPKKGESYAIGADAAAGVGRDKSAFVVLNKRTNQPVLFFRSNQIKPESFATYIADASARYNNALVLVEAMTQGLVVLNELNNAGFSRFWKDQQGKDFVTNRVNKVMIFEDLAKDIRSKKIRILETEVVDDLRCIIVDENGLIKFGHNGKSHCDNAMALALANHCLKNVTIKVESFIPDWIRKKRADNIKQNSGASIAAHRRY